MAKKYDKINYQEDIWMKEYIPDESLLYCYVHKKGEVNHITRQPLERAFRNTPYDTGTDKSSDWNKYSTPEATRNRLAKQPKRTGGFKNPNDYCILQLSVQKIRSEIPSQKIKHDPIQNHQYLPDNRAHTKIFGEKDPEVRLKFVDISEWVIPPDQ